MKFYLTLSFLLFVAFSRLSAQTAGKISGVVKDAKTGEVIIGCNILVVGTTLGAASDIEGAYFILNIPPGKYDLQASMVGYDKVTQLNVVVNSSRTTTADFLLSQTSIQQQEVIIEATRPDVEKEKTSTSAIVRSDEVKALAGIRDVGDVIALAADVTDGHFRGGRANEEFYTLQGMGIVNPLDNSSAFLPIMSAVEEVEVITSGFGAQYGNAQSGVVNISMKEGKGDVWRTTLDARTRLPGYKHFGPSVYDPAANPYLALLLDTDVWLHGDPNSDQQSYWGSMGSGLNGQYMRDTAVQVAVAQALWMQTRRDINRTYGQKPDFSFEGSTGGPISEQIRMFLALRSNTVWSIFPTPEPNTEVQAMGNIVVDLKGGKALRISGGFTKENGILFPGSDGTGGYQRWLWDRISGVNYRERSNLQLGARFSHALSAGTFYELKLNTLFTKNIVGATPVPASIPDSNVIGDPGDIVQWSFILPVYNNSPDGLNYQVGYDLFRNERTRTISFDGSITSQLTNAHLLNGGIQLNSYHIDVSNVINLRSSDYVEEYIVNPFELGLYLQDKMEFEGLIANVGLRMDLWSSGADAFTDPFLPYGDHDTNSVYHPASAPRENAPILGRLQPRVGVSFPVSVGTVFHLNYGSFMQRAPFQFLVASRTVQGYNRPVVLGNASLQPEVTNSYDIGVTQALGDGFTLDVSGYYKDVKDLAEQANFTDLQSSLQTTSYYNIDYADIRGFRVAINRRKGAIQGSLNYQFSVATGKSATATAAAPAFTRYPNGDITTDLSNVPSRDILLDFDRTHNIVLNLIYQTGAGPTGSGSGLLDDVSISISSFLRSGRPYTSPQHLNEINSMRTPNEYESNMRLTKRVRNFFGVNASFYFEVFNLFNNRILNYNYLFRRPTSTSQNLPLEYYEQYGIDDPEGPRYWYNKGAQDIFAIDQSFLIYDNAPRSFNVGFSFDF